MFIVGVDTGIHGAIVALKDKEIISCLDIGNKRGKMHEGLTAERIKVLHELVGGEAVWYIEKAGVRTTDSRRSAQTFGYVYGVVVGVLASLRCRWVAIGPLEWQGRLKKPKGKEGSLWLANQIWETWTFDRHDQADAALIAEYGRLMESANVFGIGA